MTVPHTRRLAVIGLALVLTLGTAVSAEAASWTTHGSATAHNNGAKHGLGIVVGSRAPTQRDATKHRVRVKWTGATGIRVVLGWDNQCWNVQNGKAVNKTSDTDAESVLIEPGATYTRTWNQSRDYCSVGARAFNELQKHNTRKGALILTIQSQTWILQRGW